MSINLKRWRKNTADSNFNYHCTLANGGRFCFLSVASIVFQDSFCQSFLLILASRGFSGVWLISSKKEIDAWITVKPKLNIPVVSRYFKIFVSENRYMEKHVNHLLWIKTLNKIFSNFSSHFTDQYFYATINSIPLHREGQLVKYNILPCD